MPDDEFRRERPAVVAGHGRAAEAPEQDAPVTTVPELDFPERVATAAQPQVQDLVLDTIGPKPEGVQRSVWTAMERLHRVLGHPTTTQMANLLQRWGASPQAIEAAKHIQCTVCAQVVRPQGARAASVPDPDAEPHDWNRRTMFDQYSVVLSDGTPYLILGICAM